MTAYTKSTNFATKDTLTSGDPLKIVKGTEINTEFDNIATAVNSKSDTASPTFTGTVTAAALTTTGNTILGDASTDTLNVGNGGLVKDASGNVGIGTSSPATIVHAQKSSGNTYYRAQNNLANADYGVDSAGTAILWNNSNYPIAFGTNNTERMRILTTGNILSLSGGSTTATGTGIAFPATQSASSDANTLDDYEEGTWTPSLGGNTTYSQQGGTYKKVGALVYVSAIVQVNVLGTGSSSQISGFPFTYSAGPRNTFSLSYWASTVGNISYLAFYLSSGTTGNTIATTAAASSVSDNYGVFQNGTYVMFSGCYHAS